MAKFVCFFPETLLLASRMSRCLPIPTGNPGDHLPVKTQAEKLIQLKIKVCGWFRFVCFFYFRPFSHRRVQGFVLWFSQGNDHVCSGALSPCGSWLAYSALSGVRLYRLQYNNISITKVGTRNLVMFARLRLSVVLCSLTTKLSLSVSFLRCPNCPRSFPQAATSASPQTHPNSLLPPIILQLLLPPWASWSANTFTL